MTSVSTGDGCCHVTVTINNANPFLSCPVTLEDSNGVSLGTITGGQTSVFNFYPCPPTDNPNVYTGGTYKIKGPNKTLCKTFQVRALCAF